MALRALILRKRIEEKRARLAELMAESVALATRSDELAADIEAAQTDEEKAATETAVTAFEADDAANKKAVTDLEEELRQLESELETTEVKTETPVAGAPAGQKKSERKDETRMNTLGMTLREQRRESLKSAEVRDFYQGIVDIAQKRAGSVTGTELVIPQIVLDRIEAMAGDYATLYPLVENLTIGGTSRVVLDGASPEAVWIEMEGAITELTASLTKVELDGWKACGYMALPNNIIEDSMIDIVEYVEKKLAFAIAKSRDKAILNGTGATGKQPVGIIPSLVTANAPAAIAFDLGEVLAMVGLVDDGETSYGPLTCVMRRSTFYGKVVPSMVTTDSAGRFIAPDVASPNLAGLPVKFSQYMPADKMLIGDFKRYLMITRSGMKIAQSTDVKFIEDQTVVKATQRMDGKPVHVDATAKTKDWVLVTLS